jgi:hypothetical protein
VIQSGADFHAMSHCIPAVGREGDERSRRPFCGEDLKNAPVTNCTVQAHGDSSTLSGAKAMNWKRR